MLSLGLGGGSCPRYGYPQVLLFSFSLWLVYYLESGSCWKRSEYHVDDPCLSCNGPVEERCKFDEEEVSPLER